jgi:hypothetical protein
LTAIGISLQSPGLGGDATISLIAGTVIEAVASLFFVLSNNARKRMESFFDKLRTDRKLEEALKLTSEMKDLQMQAALQAVLALGFAGSKVPQVPFPVSVLSLRIRLQAPSLLPATEPALAAKRAIGS